nr:hypothetical protein [Actinomycetota bacterium]
MARAGMAPSAVTGVRMAFEPGRGGTSGPTRSTLVGAALAVACVLAALTFAASLDRLLDTPRLYGWDWDAMVLGGDGDDADIATAVAVRGAELGNHPDVAALAAGNVGRVSLRDGPVPAVGLDQLRGQVSPPIVGGRMPETDGEIAVGSRTLER